MVKPKAAMDQFIEGLDRLEVTRLFRTHPTLDHGKGPNWSLFYNKLIFV